MMKAAVSEVGFTPLFPRSSILGALAERIGIETAMKMVFIVPIIGATLVVFLRKEKMQPIKR
jgi:hypothetical protein